MGTHISVMRAGDLIQTDEPRKLYHAPSSPFIAGFIGETNLVEGRLTERRGDGFVVDTPLGRITAAHAARSAPRELGSAVVVSFRPEAVQVDFGNAAFTGDNQLDLTLEHLTYLGESEQLALRGSQGVPVKASVFNPPDQVLNDGDRVRCRVLPEDVLVLPVEKDLSSGT
jgi:ABC-type Fe3+/spermidine/putrescine transport system ATPase subunit